MTDTTLDLKPNERKVLASLLALGEATAAKVGEHAGLPYSTTTPKLRKLEALGLAERFHNEANQTLWRPTGTGTGDGGDAPTHGASRAADEPGTAAASGTAIADSDVPAGIESAPPGADTGEADLQATATPHAAATATEPAEPDTAEPEERRDVPADGASAAAVEPATTGGDNAPDDEHAGPSDTAAPTAKRKRPAGALEASVLAILRGDPDGQYKVNDLRKLVDKADEATGYPAASAGAIANALDKLTGKGEVITIPAKHATFQAAPAAG
ncbi:helix-turn-helix domain-containing protein [Dactylosporangium sp. CA-092794]|uniref:helix-turn-helix domain-containing protein n=1 Tax=Dactylosporangium sp. CA-092794 TaxID=3239929 RepID=UPI003D89D89E